MRIAQALISDYKGVAASVAWSPAVVLFGRNDAGKSNVLEAIAGDGGASQRRVDPLSEVGYLDSVNYVLELADLDQDEGFDASLLARLLQTRNVPPLFPYAYQHEARSDRRLAESSSGAEMSLSQFPPAPLEWDVHDVAGEMRAHQFRIGTVGRMYSTLDPVNTIGLLSTVRDELRKRALEQASDILFVARQPNYDPALDFMTLLNACLSSRRLVCSAAQAGIAWLAPSANESSQETREAAERLLEACGDNRLPVVGKFASQLVTNDTAAIAFLLIPDTHRFTPWEVSWVSGSADRLEDLARRVNEFVRSQLEWTLRRAGNVDPWLTEDDGGAAISDAVEEICASLSEHATAIAPPFVTHDYDIRVEPLSPVNWHRYNERRLRLSLALDGGERSFDLAVAGSGLAVWAGFAIEEAMREVESESDAAYSALLAQSDSEDAPERKELAPSVEPPLGERRRLYVLDEPERHLHPRAQEQAARWLAGRVDERTSLLVATHALPFLSLPTGEVEYSLVSRGSDRITRCETITGDVWGALDQRASDAGLGSRAQLLQIARAFLLVEGAHDEAVLRHFYAHQLDRHRIIILPARGAKKATSIVEAELLALLDLPMIILFDEIDAAQIVGTVAPSQKNVAAYALWEMLQNWPPERKQPHVLDFGLPDIYCALPESCVRQTVKARGGAFPGWEPILQDFAVESDGLGFKQFFVKRSGLAKETDVTDLLYDILNTCRSGPAEQLAVAIAEVLERANSM